MTTFEDRQKYLFEQLNKAEKQANFVSQNSCDLRNYEEHKIVRRQARQTRTEMRQFRGKESIFKRPEAPLAQCVPSRSVPGFKKNPDKWICYNLENVPNISERSNLEAAAMCLNEPVKADEESGDVDMESTKLTFRPPVLIPQSKKSLNVSKSATYKNSIVIYPEHVVGQKEKNYRKKNDTPKTEIAKSNQLRLDHLLNDEDSDE